MVRKATHIILILLLLLATSGITVSRHYCGSNPRSVSLITIPDPCCDTDGCCHTDTEIFQVKDDFSISAFNYDFEDADLDLLPVKYFDPVPGLADKMAESHYHVIHSPPGVRYILAFNQTFIL